MNKPKVTAVIPVYNTEAYVEQAVRSVMEQTLREIEIVVVNDGSTDGSLAIVERLAAEDGRIVIFSQPNKGLSEARNAGIDRAHGEFIHFMDSDDVLEPDTYELCYRRAADERLDFVFFDAESFGAAESGADWLDYRRVAAVGEEVRPGAAQLTLMLDKRCYRASACLSFIRTEYLLAQGLRFYPRIIHEDELFTPQLYLGAARTAGIPRSFFRRRVREGSIMGRRFSQRSLDGYMTVLAELERYADARENEAKRSDKAPMSNRRRNGQEMRSAEEARRIVDRLTSYILRPVTYHAATLPTASRLRLAGLLVRRYARHVTLRRIALLLLRAPLKRMKGIFGQQA